MSQNRRASPKPSLQPPVPDTPHTIAPAWGLYLQHPPERSSSAQWPLREDWSGDKDLAFELATSSCSTITSAIGRSYKEKKKNTHNFVTIRFPELSTCFFTRTAPGAGTKHNLTIRVSSSMQSQSPLDDLCQFPWKKDQINVCVHKLGAQITGSKY